jgi:hypothetical protein
MCSRFWARSSDGGDALTAAQEQKWDALVRGAIESDRAFILDSWIKSYQSLMPAYAKSYGMSRWDWTKRAAEWCLNGGRAMVMYPDGHEDVILGWACAEGTSTLHYVFVKHDVRKYGIARELVTALGLYGARGVRITHRPGSKLRAKCDAWGWQYRPLTREELDG